jgi:hypothetical protein
MIRLRVKSNRSCPVPEVNWSCDSSRERPSVLLRSPFGLERGMLTPGPAHGAL